MYTVSILADQQIHRQQFDCLLRALDYVLATTGEDLCSMRAYSQLLTGLDLMMHVNGVFITVAVLH